MKKVYIAGLFIYVALFILSVIYFRERTIFLDIAFHLFKLTTEHHFAIQNYRFGAAFTQIFPLTAIKLGIPLQGVMITYSGAFIIYYTTCYIICGSLLKNYRMAVVLLLFNLLLVTDTFFWIQSELPQGIAFMLVLFTFITTKAKTDKVSISVLLVLAAGTCTMAFFHPLLIFCFAYVWLFVMDKSSSRLHLKLYIVMAVFYVLMLGMKNLFFQTPYDAYAMSGTSKLADSFSNIFTPGIYTLFLQACIRKYYWIPVGIVLITTLYVYRKEWLKLGLFIGFTVGYIVLVNVVYSGSYAPAFYIENLYLPIAVFLAFPLVYDVFPLLDSKKLLVAGIIIIAVTAIFRITYIGRFYTKRLNWERKYLAKHLDEKLIVNAALMPREILLQTWGSSYEFWLLSTTEYGKTASIIFSDKVEALILPAFNRKDFITNWELSPYDSMRPPYFYMTDTISRYTIVRE
jgi:hypothetical protein